MFGQRGPEVTPWEVESRARAIVTELLPGISMDAGPGSRPAANAAGSGRPLVAERDVLLLDEPTNHLDIEAIDWLAGTCATGPGR